MLTRTLIRSALMAICPRFRECHISWWDWSAVDGQVECHYFSKNFFNYREQLQYVGILLTTYTCICAYRRLIQMLSPANKHTWTRFDTKGNIAGRKPQVKYCSSWLNEKGPWTHGYLEEPVASIWDLSLRCLYGDIQKELFIFIIHWDSGFDSVRLLGQADE